MGREGAAEAQMGDKRRRRGKADGTAERRVAKPNAAGDGRPGGRRTSAAETEHGKEANVRPGQNEF